TNRWMALAKVWVRPSAILANHRRRPWRRPGPWGTVLLRTWALRDWESESAEQRIGAESELTPPTGDLVVALTVESSLRGTHHLPTVRGNLLARRGHLGEARLPFQGDGLEEWVGDGFVASGTGNADDKKAISSLGSYCRKIVARGP